MPPDLYTPDGDFNGFQDEPVAGAADGQGIGTATAQLRAARDENGNGRYYHIVFTADDGNGGACSGSIRVNVPLTMNNGGAAVDDGVLFDATVGVGDPNTDVQDVYLPLVTKGE